MPPHVPELSDTFPQDPVIPDHRAHQRGVDRPVLKGYPEKPGPSAASESVSLVSMELMVSGESMVSGEPTVSR